MEQNGKIMKVFSQDRAQQLVAEVVKAFTQESSTAVGGQGSTALLGAEYVGFHGLVPRQGSTALLGAGLVGFKAPGAGFNMEVFQD